VFSAEVLNLPLRKSDPALLALLDRQAEAVLAEVSRVPAVVDAWRRTLVPLIREGRTGLAALAEAHHTSVRSLQRRLAEQGTSFQQLLDDTRRHLAEGHLKNARLDVAEIALLLGYSEQSAFTRAFRSWTGVTPALWRRQHLLDAA
jgi:AraC-like DNA-binding protein